MKTLLIPLLALTLAVPAGATDPAQKRASIRIDDLDLSSPRDLRLLDRRVAAAKERVCGSYAGARDGAEDRIAECRAGVDRQLEPRLAALRTRQRLAAR